MHRSIARLSARRQRSMLGHDRRLLPTARFLDRTAAAPAAAFAFVVLALLCIDLLVASWREAPAVLGALELAGAGGVAAVAVALMGRAAARSLAAAQVEPMRLAAAVSHELVVAGQPRAEVERITMTADRALWLCADGQRRLALDTGDGWIVLADDGLPPLRQRWIVERLRWTHALVSVTSHGADLDADARHVDDGTLAALAPCELRPRAQLPIEIQGVLPAAASGYRG